MPIVHLFGEKLLSQTRRESDMDGDIDEFKSVYDGACKIGYMPEGIGIQNTRCNFEYDPKCQGAPSIPPYTKGVIAVKK